MKVSAGNQWCNLSANSTLLSRTQLSGIQRCCLQNLTTLLTCRPRVYFTCVSVTFNGRLLQMTDKEVNATSQASPEPEGVFGCAPGVIRTRVGYTGGQLKNPTYHHLGDHTETVQLDYDPKKISYEKLLELFWKTHDPSIRSSRQYMSAIFFHNKNQEELARKTKEQMELQRQRRGIATVIEQASEFYVAEDYHQKFQLRKHPELLKHIKYSTTKELIDSSVASKLNGYVGGYGSSAQLEKEIKDFGLPGYVADKLRKIVATTEPEEC